MSLTGLDWANKTAWGAVCPQCGFVHTFMGRGLEWARRTDSV